MLLGVAVGSGRCTQVCASSGRKHFGQIGISSILKCCSDLKNTFSFGSFCQTFHYRNNNYNCIVIVDTPLCTQPDHGAFESFYAANANNCNPHSDQGENDGRCDERSVGQNAFERICYCSNVKGAHINAFGLNFEINCIKAALRRANQSGRTNDKRNHEDEGRRFRISGNERKTVRSILLLV